MTSPAIGTKVWFWPALSGAGIVFDTSMPFDATVVYVMPDERVNLSFADHEGNTLSHAQVLFYRGPLSDRPKDRPCATWPQAHSN